MTKKIAILTQPLHVNFGGTLQAFALQKTLIGMGYEVETLNYNFKEPSDLKKILSSLKHKVLLNKSIFPFFEKELQIIRAEHNKFIRNHLKYSKGLYSHQDLKNYIESKSFDVVIIGSDQVWRAAYSPRIESFFLDFLTERDDIRKIAYSASFGIDEWQFNEIKTLEIKKLLKKFNTVSVREKSAVNLCKQYVDKDVKHTLDPTLLLEAKEYLKLLNPKQKKIKNIGKIFVYILDKSESKEQMIKNISRELDKEIFYNQPEKNNKNSCFIKNLEPYIYPPIESWVESFVDADFIITDSFHGTVFSILFNKDFIVINNKDRGGARFESLLELFDLKERLVSCHEEGYLKLIRKKIDFEQVNLKLNKLRLDSSRWLENSLLN